MLTTAGFDHHRIVTTLLENDSVLYGFERGANKLFAIDFNVEPPVRHAIALPASIVVDNCVPVALGRLMVSTVDDEYVAILEIV